MRCWRLVPYWCCVVLLMLVPARVLGGWAILNDKNGYHTRGIPDEAFAKLGEFAKQGSELRAITFAPNGGWAILLDKNGYFTRNIPDEAFNKLGEFAQQGSELKAISFAPNGGWAILAGKNSFFTRNIPDEAFNKLGEFAKQGAELKAISFTPDGGWAILFDKNSYYTRNIPDAAFAKLGELAKKGAELKAITFTAGGGWAILYNKNGYATHNIPDEALQHLGSLAKSGAVVKSLTFTMEGPAIRLSQNDAATTAKVLERMAFHKVPGMSIAIIQDGKIVVERGYGVVEAGGNQPITAKTRFQAASISKPVTALGALVLVKQGKLKLDNDLDKYLVAWHIPANGFTKKKAVTARHIVTHSAGFTVHGFGGYAPGDALPTLLQVLDGKAPANSPAIRVDFEPGSQSRYSGGGFCVLQQAMIDISGQQFPKLMHELVLAPLAMNNSSFEQPVPKGFDAVAAVGHQNGASVAGKWHTYPEMAAAGLWTTPADLARFVLGVQHAHQGAKNAILPKNLATDMLTRQIGDTGLGVFLGGKGKSLSFSHNGSNCGFECVFVGLAQTGQGAVIMTNANGAGALMDEMLQNIRSEYGWPG
jgi:CubicO group peptidase (beta-lactamase class C family)